MDTEFLRVRYDLRLKKISDATTKEERELAERQLRALLLLSFPDHSPFELRNLFLYLLHGRSWAMNGEREEAKDALLVTKRRYGFWWTLRQLLGLY